MSWLQPAKEIFLLPKYPLAVITYEAWRKQTAVSPRTQKWKTHHGITEILWAQKNSYFGRYYCIYTPGRNKKHYEKNCSKIQLCSYAWGLGFHFWTGELPDLTPCSSTGLCAGASALLFICQDASSTANSKVLPSLLYWSINSFTIQVQVNSHPGHQLCFYSQRDVTRGEPELATTHSWFSEQHQLPTARPIHH